MTTNPQPWLEEGYWVIAEGVSDASRRTSHECLSFSKQLAGGSMDLEDHVRNINIFMDGWKRMCLRPISNAFKVYLVDGHTPKEAKELALGAIDAAFMWSGAALDAKKANWPSTKEPPTPEDEFFEWIANAGFPRELIRQSFDLPSMRAAFESAFQRLLEDAEKKAHTDRLAQLKTMRDVAEALNWEHRNNEVSAASTAWPQPPEGSVSEETSTGESDRLFVVSDDTYGSIWYRGQRYDLTSKQSMIIQFLHTRLVAGFPVVAGAAILEAAEMKTKRLRDAFKQSNKTLWGTLIIKGNRKGTYRLNLPEK